MKNVLTLWPRPFEPVRCRPLRSKIGLLLLLTVPSGACGDDSFTDPPHGDAYIYPDASDAALPDRPVLPDRIIDPEGPTIQIQQPQPLAILDGDQIQVIALVTDPDGVDMSTVQVILPGDQTFSMSRAGTVPDQYGAIVDLRDQPSGDLSIVVQATDINGNTNSAQVDVVRDTGPVVVFISPEEGKRYSGSANLVFEVRDPYGVEESSVTARAGQVDLLFSKLDEDADHGAQPHWILFSGEIVFDDAMFDPALTGDQRVTVSAQNISHSVTAESSVTYIVDSEGPVITINTPAPGDIVGGILTIEADVDDPAGVLDTSVVAVLGNNALEYDVPMVTTGGSTYVGTIDTRQFPTSWVFPSLSVRAADQLNNESEEGYEVAIDNTPPVASLDPPPNFHLARMADQGGIECSLPFDPVGPGAANDKAQVPQVFFLRARIEDRGNFATGLIQERISLINRSTPTLYVLDDTTQPLVVDTDGDGFCDEINPGLIPTTTPQTTDEVLALRLDPITPSGTADFRHTPALDPCFPANLTLPPGCDDWGSEPDPPEALCFATENDGFSGCSFPRALFYTVSTDEPAIYSLPAVLDNDALFCTGQQFDAMANNITEGWACAAVRAEDNAGNVGVSAPLRLLVDYTIDGVPAYDPNQAPACTGTWDAQSQTADASHPCQFDSGTQLFRENEVRRQDI